MALTKCSNCGKFFGSDGQESLCFDCRTPNVKKAVLTGDVEHDKFTNARTVVYDTPHITPEGLVNELKVRGIDITLKEILKYVADGRLNLVTIDGGTYCTGCGTKILIGTMCSTCSDKLDRFRKPSNKAEPVNEKKSSGMHTQK